MCYGSNCLFEDHHGECKINIFRYEEFEDKYGYRPCEVGGSFSEGQEFIEWYDEHIEEMNKIYKQYLKDREEELKKWRV